MDTNQTSVFPMPQSDKLLERLSKLEHELHELKRTLPEIEAQARVAGYHEGQNDLKASICALIGAISR